MSESVEFDGRTAANSAREQYSEHVCPVDDDRRMATVWFQSDTPEDVMEQIHLDAEDSRGDGGDGAGQIPLTDHERDEINFSKGRASVPHARSVKGLAAKEGVSDWLAHYDPTLTVDEHREVMENAAREGGGRRRENTTSTAERAAVAAKTAKSEQCDHAKGHCENGDPDACEYLKESCDFDADEVTLLLNDARHVEDDDGSEQSELVTVGGDEYPEMDVTPAEAGALRDSWTGYKSAVGELDSLLESVREEIINGRQAISAVNAIRSNNGQDEIHPNRLHDELAALEDLPGDVPEVRTLEHYRDPDSQDLGEHVDANQSMGARPIGEQAAGTKSRPFSPQEVHGDDYGPTTDRPAQEVYEHRPRRGPSDEDRKHWNRENRKADESRPERRAEHRDERGRQSLPKAPQQTRAAGRRIDPAAATDSDDPEDQFTSELHALADAYQGWTVLKDPAEPREDSRLYARLRYEDVQDSEVAKNRVYVGDVRILTHDQGERTYQAKVKISTGRNFSSIRSSGSETTTNTMYDDTVVNGDREEVAAELWEFFEHGEDTNAKAFFRPSTDPNELVNKADEPDLSPGEFGVRDPADYAENYDHLGYGDDVLVHLRDGRTLAGMVRKHRGDQLDIETANGTALVSLMGLTPTASLNGHLLGAVERITEGRRSLPKAPQRPATGRTIDPTADGEQWSADVSTQGTIDSGAEQTEKAGQDQQVTLGGESADNSPGALPAGWTREGSNWRAGPFTVQLDSHSGDRWNVRLTGNGEHMTIADGVRDATTAERIAEAFTDELAPDEVTFHSSDSETMEAAAKAKKEATDTEGGLSQFQ